MDYPSVVELGQRFGASGRTRFRDGPGGLPIAEVSHGQGSVEFSLHGFVRLLCWSLDSIQESPESTEIRLRPASPDFGDDEYHQMLCIETANAKDDVRTVGPGQEHTLVQTLRVEPVR